MPTILFHNIIANIATYNNNILYLNIKNHLEVKITKQLTILKKPFETMAFVLKIQLGSGDWIALPSPAARRFSVHCAHIRRTFE